jgi:crotonobetainyl-CoA:carnitine CoA-transferase CaiB-like acyl-CoA transferase
LKDLFVLDLSTVLAGPSAAMFFAEMGASVIKIEKPEGGDVTRSWKLPEEDAGSPISSYYCSINYGKKILSLNLKKKENQEKLYQLVKKADIIINNSAENVSKKLGIHYSQLKKINPTLIYGQITGYPNKEKPAYDVVLQAETGYISMTGTNQEHLAKLPVAFIDLIAAHQLKEGILTGLYLREKTKKGYFVSVSLYESALSALANQASNFLMENYIPVPMGISHPNIAPYGDIFSSKDDVKFVLAVGNDVQFSKLYQTFGPDISWEKVKNNHLRVRNRKDLIKSLQKVFSTMIYKEIHEKLETLGIPYGKIKHIKEVLEDQEAQKSILQYKLGDRVVKCMRTASFTINAF